MKKIACFLVLLGLLVTGGLGYASMARPVTLAGAGFLGWAVSPYIFLFFLLSRPGPRAHVVMVSLLAITVAVFGMAMILDSLYVHPNAQGGLVFIVAPVWQWGGLLLGGLYRLVAKKMAAGRKGTVDE